MSWSNLSKQILHNMLRLKASNIRDAVKHAQAAIDAGADPCEALCIIEDYANDVDPDHEDNVISISKVTNYE
ncbi:hypothetical protein ACR0ST_04215 [Aliidiomarina sp. Khilg15.8]